VVASRARAAYGAGQSERVCGLMGAYDSLSHLVQIHFSPSNTGSAACTELGSCVAEPHPHHHHHVHWKHRRLHVSLPSGERSQPKTSTSPCALDRIVLLQNATSPNTSSLSNSLSLAPTPPPVHVSVTDSLSERSGGDGESLRAHLAAVHPDVPEEQRLARAREDADAARVLGGVWQHRRLGEVRRSACSAPRPTRRENKNAQRHESCC